MLVDARLLLAMVLCPVVCLPIPLLLHFNLQNVEVCATISLLLLLPYLVSFAKEI